MSLAQTVMHFASPALCGIKPASLFSLTPVAFERERAQFAAWTAEFAAAGKGLAVIQRSARLLLVFAYDARLLQKTLAAPECARYLAAKGYPVREGLPALLGELFARLSLPGGFPHEVGLFLGYPLADVVAFEQDAGRGSKYTGFWQVYGNVEEACRQMRRYRECSAACCKLLGNDANLPAVCRRYAQQVRADAPVSIG